MRKYSNLEEEILFEEFKKKKEEAPFLNKVFIYEDDKEGETAYIDTTTWNIYINKKFVADLMNKGLDLKTIYGGIITHEIGHHLYYPSTLEIKIIEIDLAKKEGIPLGAINLFDDFVDNTLIILNEKEKDMSEIYKKIDDDVMNILNLYYTKLCKLLGSKYSFTNTNQDQIPEEVSKLLKIFIDTDPYKNITKLKDFYKIMEKYQLEGLSMEDLIKGLVKSYGSKKVEKKIHELEESGTISSATAKEIEKALKDIINEGNNRKKEKDKRIGMNHNSLNKSSYDRYFEHLEKAKEYHIRIKDNKSIKIVPEYLEKISYGELNPYDVDLFASIVSGGISWYRWEKNSEDSENNLLLIIDSSGSMPPPNITLSPAVISAMTIALHYIENGKVAVANFSDNTIITPFTKDKEEVCRAIYKYQDQGTTLNINKIKNILDQPQDKDVVMITDEEISNYNKVIELFRKETKKAYIISINKYYNNQIKKDGNIIRIYVNKPDDIAKIVIGESE